jgi:hypothetical protein
MCSGVSFFFGRSVNAPFLHDTRRFRLCRLDPREFRHVAPSTDAVHTVELPASHLKERSENTAIAAAPDDTRSLLHTPCSLRWGSGSTCAVWPLIGLPPFAPVLG